MKKKTGIKVWEEIQRVLDENPGLFVRVEPHNQALRLEDVDPDSDFFFEFGIQKADNQFELKFKPDHPDHVHISHENVDQQTLAVRLQLWLDILEMYTKIASPYDDPITDAYTREFKEAFNLVDEDANVAPYDLERQIYISEYLLRVKGFLKEHKENATEPEKLELDALELDRADLEKNLTKLTKNQVVQKLASFWAKCRKFGLPLLKDVYQEAKKEVIKSLVKASVDGVPTIIKFLETYNPME